VLRRREDRRRWKERDVGVFKRKENKVKKMKRERCWFKRVSKLRKRKKRIFYLSLVLIIIPWIIGEGLPYFGGNKCINHKIGLSPCPYIIKTSKYEMIRTLKRRNPSS